MCLNIKYKCKTKKFLYLYMALHKLHKIFLFFYSKETRILSFINSSIQPVFTQLQWYVRWYDTIEQKQTNKQKETETHYNDIIYIVSGWFWPIKK